jgi:hypothetical protein
VLSEGAKGPTAPATFQPLLLFVVLRGRRGTTPYLYACLKLYSPHRDNPSALLTLPCIRMSMYVVKRNGRGHEPVLFDKITVSDHNLLTLLVLL